MRDRNILYIHIYIYIYIIERERGRKEMLENEKTGWLVGWLVGCRLLWHIKPFKLFNAIL